MGYGSHLARILVSGRPLSEHLHDVVGERLLNPSADGPQKGRRCAARKIA